MPSSLHPLLVTDQVDSHVRGYLFPPLITLDQRFQWQCHLCRQLPTLENGLMSQVKLGGDHQVMLTIELRDDLRWGDGKPVTGDDLHFAWTLAKASNEPSHAMTSYRSIAQIKVNPTSTKTVNIVIDAKNASYYNLRHLYLVPKHLEQERWLEAKRDFKAYLKRSRYLRPTHPGLFLGAFTVESIDDRKARLKANPTSAFAPAVGRVVAERAQSAKSALARRYFHLISEEFSDLRKITSSTIKADLTKKPGYVLTVGDTNTMETLFLNLRSPNLMDRNVRATLAVGVDRNELYGALFAGLVFPAWGAIHPQHAYFSLNAPIYPFDRQLAVRTLTESRWIVAADGLRTKGHRKLMLNLATDRAPHRRAIARMLRDHYATLGIKVVIKEHTASTFRSRVIAKSDFEDILLASIERPVRFPLKAFFHKDRIPSIRNDYNGYNLSQWVNTDISKLLDAGETSSMFGDQTNLERIQQLINRELPIIPLFFYLKGVIHRPELAGMRLPVDFHPASIWAHEWTLGSVTGDPRKSNGSDSSRSESSRPAPRKDA